MANYRQRDHRRLSTGLRDIGLILVGLVIVLWTYGSLFQPGLPYTHDGQIHLTRVVQYYITLKESQLPPRWAGGLNNGFGYPVFNFNYPLPQLIAYPLLALHLSAVSSAKLITFGCLMVGFLGMFFFVRLRLRTSASFIGALFYCLNPYVTNLIYVRGSLGELVLLALLPWLLYLLTQVALNTNHRYGWVIAAGLVGGMYLIAHNVLVMITAPILIVYSLWISRRQWRMVGGSLLIVGVIAGLLAAFFWLPAIGEKPATILDSARSITSFKEHFLTGSQLVLGKSGFGFSYSGPVDSMNFSLGWAQMLILLVAVPLAIKTRSRPLLLCLGSLAGCLVLSLTLSQRFWNLIPLLHYVQFPWRFLFGATFLGALVASYTYAYLPKARLWWIVIMGLLIGQSLNANNTTNWINPTTQDLQYASETTSTMDENMPKWFDKNQAYELKTTVFGDQLVVSSFKEPIQASISLWNGTDHIYSVNLQQPTRLVERSAYFPGWVTRIDGKQVAIDYQEHEYPGLISYLVPIGHHQIESRFTQGTPPRMIGNGLSLMGLILLVGGSGILGGKLIISRRKGSGYG